MKKTIIISAVLAAAILNCEAQPNGGFENWTTVFSYQTPDSWQTINLLSTVYPPNPLSAFKATGVDKHSGNYALKLKTIFINNNPDPQQLPDTVGDVFTGKIILSPPSIVYGFPYTERPEKLEFWAKYIPVGSDVGGASAVLIKWNGITTDTIAYSYIKFDTTIASYTLFQMNLIYHSTLFPDSAAIFFASSYRQSKARVGSTLFVDDVLFTGSVGIDEQNIYDGKIKVFPNPAKDQVTILAQMKEADKVQIIDPSGKCAGIYKLENGRAVLNTGSFAAGNYFYTILDKKEKALLNAHGKFNIIK